MLRNIPNSKWILPAFGLLAFAVHFLFPWDLPERKLINLDDWQLISPILEKGVMAYLKEDAFDASRFHYPLKDLSFFLDDAIEGAVHLPFFWITHFLLFLATAFFLLRVARRVLPPQLGFFALIVLAIFMFHPTQVQVLQWVTARHMLLCGFFLSWATCLIVELDKDAKGEISSPRLLAVFILYSLSLLTYPLGILWIFWALFELWRRKLLSGSRLKIFLGCGVVLAVTYWLTVGKGSSDPETLTSIDLERALAFGSRSLGRGFYNLILPHRLAVFYNDASFLSWVGLSGLFVCLVLLGRKIRARFLSDKKNSWSESLPEGLSFLLLAFLLFLPQGIVFLTFSEFVWADRYTYLSLPFAALGIILIFLERQELQPKTAHAVLFFSCLISTLWIGISLHHVPYWRNFPKLLEDCIERENSSKCLMFDLRNKFFQGNCKSVRELLPQAYEHYQRNFYNMQLQEELPFYEAGCIALNIKMSVQEKLDLLPKLFDKYHDSGSIVMPITLAHLEAGDLDGAWKSASEYYLKGVEMPLSTVKFLTNAYIGHSRALCEITAKPECPERLQKLINHNPRIASEISVRPWGYQITKIVTERGALKRP